ncbi:Predicted E3 ubiquitin ligase [Phaffia rhodozyma]|uniref:RBR-type E3 ubiquitin transferase n=1 Tax=Phaffia rhodozyma TaxID=264483 RepID=A0A0F7SPN5_PHARH|nr:Predicted E3 ubiquitin ligase [Phaffia rhodozyma]
MSDDSSELEDFEMDEDDDMLDYDDDSASEVDLSEDDGAGFAFEDLAASKSLEKKPYDILYTSKNPENLREAMDNEVNKFKSLFDMDIQTATLLLRSFNWNRERLVERYMDAPYECLAKAGLDINPPSPVTNTVPLPSSASHHESPSKKPRRTNVRSVSGSRTGSLDMPSSSSSRPTHLAPQRPSTPAHTDFECPICCIDFSAEEVAAETLALGCGHRACKECWKQYLEGKIKDEGESVRIQCLESGCGRVVSVNVVESLVSAPLKERYDALLNRTYVDDNPTLRWCPAPECEYAVECKQAPPKVLDKIIPTVKCKCGQVFCFGCGYSADHRPVICRVATKWLKKCADDSETSNWISANTKECIKCHSTIEKNGGCNHMTCKKCKHEFCWVCMGDWTEHGTSWYNCNRYEEKSGQDARDSQSKSRASLERYLHYYNRWANHELSAKLDRELYLKTEKKMEQMQLTSDLTWIEVQFAKKAVDTLVVARMTLKWTYAMAYHLAKNNQTALFEDNQSDLEQAVEALSELLEKPIEPELIPALRQHVTDKTVYVQKRHAIMLDDSLQGYLENRHLDSLACLILLYSSGGSIPPPTKMSSSSADLQNQQDPICEIDRLPNPSPVSNRKWKRRARLSLVFLSIAGNCITAGGVASFPLFAPYIASHFNLEEAATNVAILGGLVGAYFGAAPVGSFVDRYGPRKTSLLASLFNITGYLSLHILLLLPPDHPFLQASPFSIHVLLSFSFLFIGLGTVSSYFCSLTTSSLTFPSHPSLALGCPLALFGLSAWAISESAGWAIFGDPTDELDVGKFSLALLLTVGGWNAFAAFGMKVMPHRHEVEFIRDEVARADPDWVREGGADGTIDEETPLLMGSRSLGRARGTVDLTFKHLMSERSFWILGMSMFLMIGPMEMIIASVGSIVTSLLPRSTNQTTLQAVSLHLIESASPLSFLTSSKATNPLRIRQKHVKIISICNTISRISVGAIADYLSASTTDPVVLPKLADRPSVENRRADSSWATPIANVSPPSTPASASFEESDVTKVDVEESRRWKHRFHMSKITMVLLTLTMLAVVYAFAGLDAGLGARGLDALWVLTGVVGWSYGCLFTLLPSITTQIFGLKTFGRNYGLLSYFVATSSLGFTYLYGLLANLAYTSYSAERVCRGAGCFRHIMWISFGSTVAAAVFPSGMDSIITPLHSPPSSGTLVMERRSSGTGLNSMFPTELSKSRVGEVTNNGLDDLDDFEWEEAEDEPPSHTLTVPTLNSYNHSTHSFTDPSLFSNISSLSPSREDGTNSPNSDTYIVPSTSSPIPLLSPLNKSTKRNRTDTSSTVSAQASPTSALIARIKQSATALQKDLFRINTSPLRMHHHRHQNRTNENHSSSRRRKSSESESGSSNGTDSESGGMLKRAKMTGLADLEDSDDDLNSDLLVLSTKRTTKPALTPRKAGNFKPTRISASSRFSKDSMTCPTPDRQHHQQPGFSPPKLRTRPAMSAKAAQNVLSSVQTRALPGSGIKRPNRGDPSMEKLRLQMRTSKARIQTLEKTEEIKERIGLSEKFLISDDEDMFADEEEASGKGSPQGARKGRGATSIDLEPEAHPKGKINLSLDRDKRRGGYHAEISDQDLSSDSESEESLLLGTPSPMLFPEDVPGYTFAPDPPLTEPLLLMESLFGAENGTALRDIVTKDKRARKMERRERRSLERQGGGEGFRGVWCRNRSGENELAVEQAEWAFVRLQGSSRHPLFISLSRAVEQKDVHAFENIVSMGGLSPAVLETMDVKGRRGLLISLIENACLAPSISLSTLCLEHIGLMFNSSFHTPASPIIESARLIMVLSSAFQRLGFRVDLLRAAARNDSGSTPSKPIPPQQGTILPMSHTRRERAVGCLIEIVENAVRHSIFSNSALSRVICIIALVTLDRMTPINLLYTCQRALGVAIESISSPNEELKLCHKLVQISSPYKMGFKMGLLEAFPIAGPACRRLTSALAVLLLDGTMNLSTYGSPPSMDVLLDTLSQSKDRTPLSKFYIHPHTDYEQLVASIRILSFILLDLQEIYLAEQARAKDRRLKANYSDNFLSRRETFELLEAEGSLQILGNALNACDAKIVDARATHLDRSAAKAFLLNLRMSINYRNIVYQSKFQKQRAAGEAGRNGQTILNFGSSKMTAA